MKFHAVSGSASRRRTDCAIVGVYESGELGTAASELDGSLGGLLGRLVKRGDLRGKPAEAVLLHPDKGPAQRVLVVGLGKKDQLGRKQYRKAVAAAAAVLAKSGARDAVSYLSVEPVTDTDGYYLGRLAAEAVTATLYRVPAIRSTRKEAPPALKSFSIAVGDRGQVKDAEHGLDHGRGIGAGMSLTRDLANLPANVCTPSYLARQARQLAGQHASIKVQVLDEKELRRLKMGAFLSVTAGTEEPARLIVIRHQGGKSGEAPVVLVGKGVTFDSGGISLKQPQNMNSFSGAAEVWRRLPSAASERLIISRSSSRPSPYFSMAATKRLALAKWPSASRMRARHSKPTMSPLPQAMIGWKNGITCPLFSDVRSCST